MGWFGVPLSREMVGRLVRVWIQVSESSFVYEEMFDEMSMKHWGVIVGRGWQRNMSKQRCGHFNISYGLKEVTPHGWPIKLIFQSDLLNPGSIKLNMN